MPCYKALYGKPCRKGASCKYTHELTSLVRLLLEIRKAKRTLLVCVFTITCTEIANELVAAKKRGVNVRVITDDAKMDDQGSKAFNLKAQGINVRHDHNIMSHMHHKFAVIDNKTVLNGSFNWTRGAVLSNR